MEALENSYGIERRAAGALVTAGSIIFLAAAFIPITNRAGTIIYALPSELWPSVIRDNSTLWTWASSLFIVGVLFTAFGASLFSDALRRKGDNLFSLLGNLAIAFASLLLTFELAFRVSSATWAQEAVTNPSSLDLYIRISQWLNIIFMVYSVLMVAALAAFGASILRTSLMPRWSGWTLIAYCLLALVYILIAADSPPFTHYLMFLMIGVLFMRQPASAAAVSRTSSKQPLVAIQENKG